MGKGARENKAQLPAPFFYRLIFGSARASLSLTLRNTMEKKNTKKSA